MKLKKISSLFSPSTARRLVAALGVLAVAVLLAQAQNLLRGGGGGIPPAGGPVRPTLAITNVSLNLRTSNAVFVVRGKAGGNPAVSNVSVALNNSEWESAETANGWTNWSRELTLVPGTNVISAYAVDSTNTVSLTNTVKLVYILSAPLTVNTNGKGGISPAYNNSRLQIGASYSMTAKANTGFAFTTWTDGGGNVVTNSATLKFTMASNLVFIANFVDVTKPVLTITNPLPNASVSNQNYFIGGKAGDNVAVAGVYFKLNGDDWSPAATLNQWSNWTANVSLAVGTNILSAYAVDAATNFSTTNTVRFVYVLTTTLTISTNGRGSISPNYNNQRLRIGQNYSMTATAGAGFAFTNWSDGSGGIITNKPALQFMMASNLVFVANFVDVARPTLIVTTPSANLAVTNGDFLASGHATDNAAVTGVFYSLNGADWTPAATASQWTNWTAALSLVPGTNILSVYAVDSTTNRSVTNTIRFSYFTAPATLLNLKAIITPEETPSFETTFGANTFSQFSTDTNNANAIGNYTYARLTPSTARLTVIYTAPPSATNGGSQIINLAFPAAGTALFTNGLGGESGDIQFSVASNFATASVLNQILIHVDDQGGGRGTFFTGGKFISQDLITRTTNNGSFLSYTAASRLGALLKTSAGGVTTYAVLHFSGTNYGFYQSEDRLGTNLTDGGFGFFGLASQKSGGNAPFNVTNRNAQIFSSGDVFNLDFGAATFTQSSASPDFNNGIGAYTYTRLDTNHAHLDLSYAAPVNLAGTTAAANRLIFFAANLAVFTNADGTLSAVALTASTNRAPVSLNGRTLNGTNENNEAVHIFFSDDTTFSLTDASGTSAGNFSYTLSSPGGTLAQLVVTSGAEAGSSLSCQMNFETTAGGTFYLSTFDGLNNLLSTQGGRFVLQ